MNFSDYFAFMDKLFVFVLNYQKSIMSTKLNRTFKTTFVNNIILLNSEKIQQIYLFTEIYSLIFFY